MSQHHFDTEIAKRVGVHAAIIFDNIRFWCARSKANGANFYDGSYWVYNSVSAWTELFPYMTEKQIRGALDRLYEEGLVAKGCYNKDPRDRTSWYAVAEMHLPSGANGHSPSGANAIAAEGEPLPDTNLPDTKPNPSSSDRLVDEAVELLWKLTPDVSRKRSSRKELATAIRALKGKHHPADLAYALKECIDDPQMVRDGHKYLPAIHRWIRDGRYESFLPKSTSLLDTAQPSTSGPDYGSLEYHFAFYASHKAWLGRSDGYLHEPYEIGANYPAALYAKYDLPMPEGAR